MALNKVGITIVLNRLAQSSHARARDLYAKLMSSWGRRPDREWVTVKLGEQDLSLLRSLKLPAYILRNGMVESGYIITYRHPKNKQLEVIVTTKTKLPRKKSFNIGGKKRRLVAVAVTKINKQEAKLARSRTKKKPVEEEELDELEGLEDLEDLEDLDDEEPDDEEYEDEEEEEEPAPKRTRSKKGAAKKTPAKKARRKAEPEDDEDEDEEEAPRRKSKKTAKKGAAKKNGGGNLPAARELPKGQLGPQQIADMVGGNCDARYVRIWLRESEYEREDGSRWAFNKKEGTTIARQIKADRKRAGV